VPGFPASPHMNKIPLSASITRWRRSVKPVIDTVTTYYILHTTYKLKNLPTEATYPSGGKTTTIKCLSCLSKVNSGDALILGKSILKNAMDVKELISVSPQETAIAPNLSVRENLEFICGVNGFDKNKARNYTQKTIDTFDMKEIKNKQAKKLSGGWQRRLSIAMAIISEPKILFLDDQRLY